MYAARISGMFQTPVKSMDFKFREVLLNDRSLFLGGIPLVNTIKVSGVLKIS